MIKTVTIKTTYGSTIKLDTCFHVNMTFSKLKITYLHYSRVSELEMDLKDIKYLNVTVLENEQC